MWPTSSRYPGPIRSYNSCLSLRTDCSCHVTVRLHSFVIRIYCSISHIFSQLRGQPIWQWPWAVHYLKPWHCSHSACIVVLWGDVEYIYSTLPHCTVWHHNAIALWAHKHITVSVNVPFKRHKNTESIQQQCHSGILHTGHCNNTFNIESKENRGFILK